MALLTIPAIHWIPYISIRERLERRTDRDFNSSRDDDRTIFSSRITVGTNFRSGNVSGQLIYNNNREKTLAGRGGDDVRADVQFANVTFADPSGNWTVGRQDIRKGNERLMGAGSWNSVLTAWDGVRFRRGPWDAWAVKLGTASRISQRTRMAGLSYQSGAGETLYFFRHLDTPVESVDAHTIDHVLTLKKGPGTLSLEGALQSGHRRGKDLHAWALAGRYTYVWSPKLSVALEGSLASGGGNGHETFAFDNALAGNHQLYGTMDLQDWKNSQVLSLFVNYRPRQDVNVEFGYHRFGLRDASDAWYGAGGLPNGGFVDPTGSKGRDVGDEFDLQADFTINPKVSVMVGASTFRAGNFIRGFRGSDTTNQNWLFVQATYRY